MKRSWIKRLKIVVIVYCVIGIAIYYLQDIIFFHPEELPRNHSYDFSQPFKEVNIPINAEANMNVIQFNTSDSTRGVVLYFHGNKQNIARYAYAAPAMTKHGYDVWMLDYPGFGKSTGKFNEQTLYQWALTFYQLARARFSPDSIIIYGKSMGTGIASQLASVRDCKYLLLETPYYSFPSIIDSWLPIYPTNKMIRTEFPNYKHIKDVTAPIVIWHGTNDWTVPLRNAKRLLPILKPTDKFILIEGGKHNNLRQYEEYKNSLDSLLKRGEVTSSE